MENKYNVLDPVLVYATIDSVTSHEGKLVYGIKITTQDGLYEFIDLVSEESIQTVF